MGFDSDAETEGEKNQQHQNASTLDKHPKAPKKNLHDEYNARDNHTPDNVQYTHTHIHAYTGNHKDRQVPGTTVSVAVTVDV